MKRTLFCLMLCFALIMPYIVFAGNPFVRAPHINRFIVPRFDSITASSGDNEKYSYLDLGVDYVSNSNLHGQFNNIANQPSWSANASLTTKRGLDLSAGYSLLQNADTSYNQSSSEISLGLGYSVEFLEYFSLRGSFSHYAYGNSKTDNSLRSGFNNSLEGDLGYDFKWLSGSIAGSYMFGKKTSGQQKNSNSFFLTFSNGLNLEVDNLSDEENTLSIQPGFNINMDDQKMYNEYLLKNLENPTMINKLRKKHPDLTIAQAKEILLARTSKKHQFTITSFALVLPLSYSVGDFTISVAVSGYKPLNQPDFVDSSWKVVFAAGLSYSFSW